MCGYLSFCFRIAVIYIILITSHENYEVPYFCNIIFFRGTEAYLSYWEFLFKGKFYNS